MNIGYAQHRRNASQLFLMIVLIETCLMPVAFCQGWQVNVEPEDVKSRLVFLEKMSENAAFNVWVQDSRSVNQPNGCIVDIRKPAKPRDENGMELDGTFELKLDWVQGRSRSHIDIINGTGYKSIEYSVTLGPLSRTGKYCTTVKIFVDSLIADLILEKEEKVTIVVQQSTVLTFMSIWAGVMINLGLTVFVKKKETRLRFKVIVLALVGLSATILVAAAFLSQFPEMLNSPFYYLSLAFSAGFALESGSEKILSIVKSIRRRS